MNGRRRQISHYLFSHAAFEALFEERLPSFLRRRDKNQFHALKLPLPPPIINFYALAVFPTFGLRFIFCSIPSGQMPPLLSFFPRLPLFSSHVLSLLFFRSLSGQLKKGD